MGLFDIIAIEFTALVLVYLKVTDGLSFAPDPPRRCSFGKSEQSRISVQFNSELCVQVQNFGSVTTKLLLASTPALLLAQMLLLPVYLSLFLGEASNGLVHLEPFIHAFVWIIAIPLGLAAVVELLSKRSTIVHRISGSLGLLPVPATALVLFVVVAAVVPQLGLALQGALTAVPIYIAFAVLAPIVGLAVAKISRLDVSAGRALAFSAGTRNSLVVLPLAFAVPGAMPLLPAIIVTQTMVELLSELIYIKVIPMLTQGKRVLSTSS